jgi:hypothetical protein
VDGRFCVCLAPPSQPTFNVPTNPTAPNQPCPARICPSEVALHAENGAVKKCMVAKADALGAPCRRELARSLHMSFFVWQPKGVVTQPCDQDIERLCLLAHPSLQQMPGAVGACLTRVVSLLLPGSELPAGHI